MKRLTFAEQALQDLQEIHDFIAKDSPGEALEFIARLEERCHSLCQMPGMGRRREDLAPGLRSSRVGDHLIFYRQFKSDIVIVHVLHGARDLPTFFELD